MPKQKIQLELDVPEGFEATGEYRCRKPGETVLIDGGAYTSDLSGFNAEFPILRKVEPKRHEQEVWVNWYAYCAIPHSNRRSAEIGRSGSNCIATTRHVLEFTEGEGLTDTEDA